MSTIEGKKSKLSTGQLYMQLLIFVDNLGKHQIVHYCNYSDLLSMARRRANFSHSPYNLFLYLRFVLLLGTPQGLSLLL